MVCAMIDEIHVENLALIKEATLAPSAGCTVLTGETGAGKTALLSALKLIMGERADSAMVREGEPQARVTARLFRDSHDTEGVIVERQVSADGRSRVRLDGAMSSVKELSASIGPCIDLCGQHEHQRLLDADTHVLMVDAWAGDAVSSLLDDYRTKLSIAHEAERHLRAVDAAARSQGSKVEEARFCCERIDEVNPAPGEYESLEETLPRAEHAELLISTALEAQQSLQDENGVLDVLNAAIAELSHIGDVDAKLALIADNLSGAAIELEDSVTELRRYRESIDFDAEELSRMQERFSAMRALLRQWGPTMDDVFAARDEARELLAVVDNGAERVKKAQRELEKAENDLYQASKKLNRMRAKMAPRFCREVAKQMARLDMTGAELIWDARDLPRAKWSNNGPQSCELLYRSGAGLTPRPLRRIASGGELSRVMLACKVVLGSADGADTLVFDEVDAGVGGSTARSLAAVLHDLAKTHQVIVVTHLAQVSVIGDRHYAVKKTVGDLPETHLTEVSGEDRVREVARLLSGDDSQVSLEHARQLLEGAA